MICNGNYVHSERKSMTTSSRINIRLAAFAVAVSLALISLLALASPDRVQAHAVTASGNVVFTYYPPTSPPRTGCVKTTANLGESYQAGKIAINSWGSVWDGSCTVPKIGGGTVTTILAKYNGTGPWGGFTLCREWHSGILTPGPPGGWTQSFAVSRPCGAGTYTVFVCHGYRYSPTYIWAGDAGSSNCYSGPYTAWFKTPNHTF